MINGNIIILVAVLLAIDVTNGDPPVNCNCLTTPAGRNCYNGKCSIGHDNGSCYGGYRYDFTAFYFTSTFSYVVTTRSCACPGYNGTKTNYTCDSFGNDVASNVLNINVTGASNNNPLSMNAGGNATLGSACCNYCCNGIGAGTHIGTNIVLVIILSVFMLF